MHSRALALACLLAVTGMMSATASRAAEPAPLPGLPGAWQADLTPAPPAALVGAIGRCSGHEDAFVAEQHGLEADMKALDERAGQIAARRVELDRRREILREVQAAIAADMKRIDASETRLAELRRRIDHDHRARHRSSVAAQRMNNSIEVYNREIAQHNDNVRDVERRKAQVQRHVAEFNAGVEAANAEIQAFDRDATAFKQRWEAFAARIKNARRDCRSGREIDQPAAPGN
ncbi:MAG: hypothetical protein GC151_17670 [Betaproteobacteria bacterium]|nr:hypothetical protein [Betaproteobacteria bacterium]